MVTNIMMRLGKGGDGCVHAPATAVIIAHMHSTLLGRGDRRAKHCTREDRSSGGLRYGWRQTGIADGLSVGSSEYGV